MDNRYFKALKSGFSSILKSELASTSSINEEFTEDNCKSNGHYL